MESALPRSVPSPNATLALIAHLFERRLLPSVPFVMDSLFDRLSHAIDDDDALKVEDHIWSLWMRHPNRAAERVLNLATGDIAARRFDIAETRLVRLLRDCPRYPEAWHKLATLHYLLGRDDESLAEYHRSLELEPRHFGALCAVGEILVARGDAEGAMLAFHAALRIHPHHRAARERLTALTGGSRTLASGN